MWQQGEGEFEQHQSVEVRYEATPELQQLEFELPRDAGAVSRLRLDPFDIRKTDAIGFFSLNAIELVKISGDGENAVWCVEGEEQVAKNIQFEYDETIVDHEGNFKEVHRKTMRIPLMAAITHPNICIEEGTVDFEMEVSQAEEDTKTNEAEAGLDAKVGWGPFSAKIHGKVSHKSEQTRKTDTRSKYSIHTLVKRQGPPEGLMRVIDFLTDAATKPVLLPDKVKDSLPTDTVAKIAEKPEKE